jgi:lipopolysaccharide/colanic/teichoic acid biosynthesis glycosyltransferase
VALLVLWPFYLVIALLIALEDGFPVLYRAPRGGYLGKNFRICKFRTMVKNADKIGGGTTSLHDPRITKVGRFIRRTSLDELPQLINIFVGDMTIVGPRPPLVSEVAQYTDYQRQRLLVKQGLTCYWQCSGRNNINFEEWVELDLKYIRERSLWTDIKIIFKTIPAVLSGDGAG